MIIKVELSAYEFHEFMDWRKGKDDKEHEETMKKVHSAMRNPRKNIVPKCINYCMQCLCSKCRNQRENEAYYCCQPEYRTEKLDSCESFVQKY